jgi:two-component system, chemotaxis family, sensor kinase Cph1
VKDMESGNYARAQGDLKRIEAVAAKMTSLLNDLLALSLVGKMMNAPSQVDMNRLVRDILGLLAGPLANHHIKMVAQPDLPPVHGDRQRIAEVVQNLVENAIKYMGDQEAPGIEIGARQDGKERVFFVSDNGKGIDQRFQQNIFGLFNQLDPSSEGTGVGLALVKRIIEVHGGRVWVESEGAGKGSRFCYTLPDK